MAAKKGLVKPTIQITALSFAGIILSFITQLVVAYFFGASSDRDAYFAALVLTTYVSAVLIGSIGVMFLPMYVDIKTKRSEQEANRFLNSTISFGGIIGLLIIVGGALFSDQIISATAPGFDAHQVKITSRLLIVLLPTIVLQIITSLAGSALQVQHRFLLPAVGPLIAAFINLVAVISFNQKVGIESLAYGTLAGAVISCLIVVKDLYKRIGTGFTITVKDKDLFKLMAVSLPMIIAAIIGRVSEVFERGMASTLEPGSVSYLGYARQLLVILTTVATTGLATSVFPTISKAWSERDMEGLRHYFIKCIHIIFLITLPIAAIFVVLSEPIISIVFERGAFDHRTAENVSGAFTILMGSFICLSLGSILAKIIYFTQQTYYGLLIGIIEAASYLLTGYFFIDHFSFLGLAIASSISTFMNIAACLIVLLRIKILTRKELSKMNSIFFLNCLIVVPLSILLYFTYHLLIRYCSMFLATALAVSLFLALLLMIYTLAFTDVKKVCQLLLRQFYKPKSYA